MVFFSPVLINKENKAAMESALFSCDLHIQIIKVLMTFVTLPNGYGPHRFLFQEP